MVAVGLSPRNNGRERVRVAERRLNRRANRALQASLRDAWFLLPPRGLKPTATVMASLCEAESTLTWRPKNEMRLKYRPSSRRSPLHRISGFVILSEFVIRQESAFFTLAAVFLKLRPPEYGKANRRDGDREGHDGIAGHQND